jgi:hypothetical protein
MFEHLPRPRRALASFVLLLLLAAVTGCKGTTPIKTLLDDPSRFDHQVVRISGDVEEAAGVLGYGVFLVNDGTGTLTVLTQTGGAPRTGAKVGVEGEFRSAFTLGTQSMAALMEQKRYTP